jgi:uncharacterized membrane protein
MRNWGDPRLIIWWMILDDSFKAAGFSLITAFLLEEKEIIQTQEANCEIIVAQAAPSTPQRKTNMKIGSRIVFITAPRSIAIMVILGKPWALVQCERPKPTCMKMAPYKMIWKYRLA